jgi:hypothetical protein
MSRVQKELLALATLVGLFANLTGCGGGNGGNPPPPTITVTISPLSVTVYTGGTQQFTATVTGTSNKAVSWSVGGNCGSVSDSGLYTAPTASACTGTVIATSKADVSKHADASVEVKEAVHIAISPETASVYAGASQQFTATVTGTSNTAVTWSVSDSCGSISDTGLYTAPLAICSGTVKATSKADTTKSASASISVVSEIALARVIDSGGVGVFHNVAMGADGKVYAAGSSGTSDAQFGVVVRLNYDFSDNWKYVSQEQSRIGSLLITPEYPGKVFFVGAQDTDPQGPLVLFGRLNAETGALEKGQTCRIGGNDWATSAQYRNGKFYIGIFGSWNGPALVTADGDCNLDCEHPINIRPAGGDMYDFAFMPDYIIAAGSFSCGGGANNCLWVAKVDYAGGLIGAEATWTGVFAPKISVAEEDVDGDKLNVIYLGATAFGFLPALAEWVQKLRESDLVEFWNAPVTFGDNTSCGVSPPNWLYDLLPSPSGGATAVGVFVAPNCASSDVVAALVSPNGELLRVARSALAGSNVALGGAYDSSGRLFLAGQHRESSNGYPALYTWKP